MLTYTFTLPQRAVDGLTILGAWPFLFGVLFIYDPPRDEG